MNANKGLKELVYFLDKRRRPFVVNFNGSLTYLRKKKKKYNDFTKKMQYRRREKVKTASS